MNVLASAMGVEPADLTRMDNPKGRAETENRDPLTPAPASLGGERVNVYTSEQALS